jgi:hypothetical protein
VQGASLWEHPQSAALTRNSSGVSLRALCIMALCVAAGTAVAPRRDMGERHAKTPRR